MQDIPLTQGPALFEGAVSIETVDGGIRPFRLRSEDRKLHFPGLAGRADVASGVRIIVITDSKTAELDVTVTDSQEPASIDAVIAGDLVASQSFQPTGAIQTIRFENLPAGSRRLELWLPQFGHTTVHALRLDDDAQAEAYSDPRPKWITYGSSITMCRQATSPARTWPATVARLRDINLTSLGFGGQCHFDPLVARTIRDLPADFINLKLGINTYGGTSFSTRTWGPVVLGFILTVRDGHPETPLLICSPIFAENREDEPNRADMTLADMRHTLEDLVATLRDHGDENLHYLNGHALLGPDDAEGHLMPDGVHPNGAGYEQIGRRFADLAFAPKGPFPSM